MRIAFDANRMFRRFCRDQHGATAIEYTIIASGIAVAIVVAVYALGNTLVPAYQAAEAGLN